MRESLWAIRKRRRAILPGSSSPKHVSASAIRYNSHQTMKLADIARALGARIENAAPGTEMTAVAGIEQVGPGQLTFVSNPKYNAAARTTRASAVIVAENFPAIPTGMLRSKNPYLAWEL